MEREGPTCEQRGPPLIAIAYADDVHCRESVGTGPVVLKVVPAMGAVWFRYHHGPFFSAPLPFPTPTST